MKHFAVIPAAGKSRRMGQPKLALPWGSGTVIEATLAAWRRGRVDAIVVVARSCDEIVRQACEKYRADLAAVEDSPPDMKESVLIGLDYIESHHSPSNKDAWLLAPADFPWLNAHVVDQLIDKHEQSPDHIIVPIHQQRRGHPVLFPWPVAALAKELTSDEGINRLLKTNAVQEVECGGPEIHGNLNTESEYLAALVRYQPS